MARRLDDDDAPWLAEAAPAPRTEVSRRSFFWTVLIVLALVTIAVVGAILLMAKKDGGSTQGYMNAEQAPVISAEPGPYKIKPADPAGMQIEGIDGTMYNAGAGIDEGSAIDPSLAPEAPLPRPGTYRGVPEDLLHEGVEDGMRDATPPPIIAAPPAAAPAVPVTVPRPNAPADARAAPGPAAAKAAPPAPAVKPAAKPLVILPPAAAPASAAAGRVGTVQLGAFSSAEKADAAWGKLAGNYGLSGKRISPVETGGKTLYRLRATSGNPAATCARMKAAGDACAAVE